MGELSLSNNNKSEIDCLGLGIIPYDLLYFIDEYPEAGTKIDAVDFHQQGGGPVPSAMIGLARLGCSTAMIAAVGGDPFGELGIKELKDNNVDHTHMIIKKDKASALATGWIERGEEGGRRTMVLARDIAVEPSDLDTDSYPIPRAVHLDGRDLEACLRLAEWAKEQGALISFDIGSMRNDVSPIFPLVDHLVVAHDYAFGFTKERSIERAIDALAEHCNGTIVITEGIKGSTGREGGELVRQRAYKVDSVDTTGAGDAFHTGYIYGLLHDMNLQERLRFGAAVAALKCTKPGARTGLPTLSEVEEFISSEPSTYA